MVENYQREILSPIQIRKKPYDISGQNHPARDEIVKCLGDFNLSISVEEDLETLKLFDRIPGGVVAFIARVFTEDGQCVGIGRGSAIFSRVNKYLSRTVRSAFCASIIDGIVKSCKGLDAIFFAGPEYQQNIERSQVNSEQNKRRELSPRRDVGRTQDNFYRQERSNSYEPATEKQKNYLLKLLSDSGDDYEPDEISGLSKSEAAEKIGMLVGSR